MVKPGKKRIGVLLHEGEVKNITEGRRAMTVKKRGSARKRKRKSSQNWVFVHELGRLPL